MNRRNGAYIGRYNDRSRYPLVDDKLKTKLLAEKYAMATPRLHRVIRYQHEIASFCRDAAALDGFAVKPAKGSGGKGILVITRRRGDMFIKSSGKAMSVQQIKLHMSNILAGLYSLGGTPDVAIVEDLIRPAAMFEQLSYEGVPDIRIIVFKGYPIMAMLRLSTRESDGTANLHKGAVGVGLDIATGQALHAVQHTRLIKNHPDTGISLETIAIPDWRNLLVLAARSYELTGLGYIGTDLVIDAARGPLLLELNARPGLSIQVANGQGLLPRLKTIEQIDTEFTPAPEHRVDFSIEMFGAEGCKN